MNEPTDLSAYRANPREVERVSRLFELLPTRGPSVLDVGARDGHLSSLLADRFERVVALDLDVPEVAHPRVSCVAGDATALDYPDNTFHTVVCAEVLEHIPASLLPLACREIVRVASHCAVIGVPYRQDLRLGCTTCRSCGATNPPWGHVNSFDEHRLVTLMTGMTPMVTDFVGRTRSASNALSARLLNFAGNPFGTYDQDETCVHCGQALQRPAARTFAQKVATRVGTWGLGIQERFTPWRGNWIHMRFEKPVVVVQHHAGQAGIARSAELMPG
ncbi:MAG: class I SAM-dependent methyltransferase [Rubrivivax sp.]|nr:class I SAM-dependent methyltransferase [Rubrivivax sp.]